MRLALRIGAITVMAGLSAGTTCDRPPSIPDGNPDEIERFVSGLIRYEITTWSVEEPTEVQSQSARLTEIGPFGRQLYADCQQQGSAPIVLGNEAIERPILADCPSWNATSERPNEPLTCAEAVCLAAASNCVADAMYDLVGAVEDYRSSRYLFTPYQTRVMVVPPQTPRANAVLLEGASDWTMRAIRVAGENLRTGLGMTVMSPITLEGVCTSVVGDDDALVADGNTIPDPLNSETPPATYTERLTQVVSTSANRVNELSRDIVRVFSGVADAEWSANVSASEAARYAWVDGDASRGRAAHILIGGPRGDAFVRALDGFGSLGALNARDLQALDMIRASALDPVHLSSPGQDLIDAIVLNYRVINDLPEDAFGPDDLLSERGLTELSYVRAARWLDNELNVFDVDREAHVASNQFAASMSVELVPHREQLLVGVRQGDDRADGTYVYTGTSYFPAGFEPASLGVPRDLPGVYVNSSLAGAVDYAAGIFGELAPIIAGPIVGMEEEELSRLRGEVASASETIHSSVHGRVEFCDNGTSKRVVYSGPEGYGELFIAIGNDQLRCATTGNLNGAPCGELLPLSGMTYGTLEMAGREAVARAFVGASPGEEVYVLQRVVVEDDEDPRAVLYEPIVGGYFPPGSGSRCISFSVVPATRDAASRLVTPSQGEEARARGAAAEGCAGIPADQRIPLEDELTDDGNQFESSWRHYLNLAAAAAAEADRLGEAVIDTGLDVERRAEAATSTLQSLCGNTIDIDFLSEISAGPGPSELCQLPMAPAGTARPNGEIVRDYENGYGYVCRNGLPMPDALETLEVRKANGDAGAIELLDCIGAGSRVPWASLGSNPLCLWENGNGSACVGARELGLDCPILASSSEDPDCEADLEEALVRVNEGGFGPVSAVTVDTNLGVFADVIGAANISPLDLQDPEDDSTPPCADLRRLRSLEDPEDREQRDAAMRRLIRSPWITEVQMRQQAERLAWQARPYDYGVVERDEAPWRYTGDPEAALFSQQTWPCGATIESSLTEYDDMGEPIAGARECEQHYGGATAGPLGCAFAADCAAPGADVANFLDRVRMNQRVGRAVLTLRLLTAYGLRDMRLPAYVSDTGTGNTEGDVERFRYDGATNTASYAFPAIYAEADGDALPNLVMPFRNVFRVTSGASVTAGENTGNNNYVTLRGAGYCVPMLPCSALGGCGVGVTLPSCATRQGGCSASNMGYLWTGLNDAAYGGGGGCDAACLASNTCTACNRIFAPCFTGWLGQDNTDNRLGPFMVRDFIGEDGLPPDDASILVTTDVWRGVGPHSAPDETDSVIRRTFQHFVNDPTASSTPVEDFDERDYDTAYFDQDWRNEIPLMEDVTHGDVMDALELACASQRADLGDDSAPAGGVSNHPCSPERLGDLEAGDEADIARLEEFLRCSADLLETNAERMVIRNVPSDIVETVQSEYGSATIPALEGERGVLVANATADIIALRTYRIQLGRVLREFADATETLRRDLHRLEVQREQIKISLQSQIADRITACAVAASPSVSVGAGGASVSFNPGAAIATCANAATQIGLAVKDMEARVELTGIDTSEAFARFTTSYQSQTETLSQIEVELIASGHRLQGTFARFEAIREQGRELLNQAMMFSSDAAGRQLRVNTLLRRRFVTTQERYERARDHAIRMSFLAKLALEQRLGVHLSDLREDMTLVDAPSSWEAALCTMSGIDFARIRDGESAASETSDELDSYADQYIGDYVDRLERVAESYRLDFPFHEGSDTAVLSMRDVFVGARDVCVGGAESPNLLAHSGDLSASTWNASTDCVPLAFTVVDPDTMLSEVVYESRDCLHVTDSVNTTAVLATEGAPWLGAARPWRVRFGPETTGDPTSARTTTALTQVLTVGNGSYVLSWYGRSVMGSPITPETAVRFFVGGSEVDLSVGAEGLQGGACVPTATDGWCRYFAAVTVPRSGPVTVAVMPDPAAPTVVGDVVTGAQTVELAGFQLEDVTRVVNTAAYSSSTVRPTAFIETDGAALTQLPVCEDTDGNVFRQGWRYDCERLCSSGIRTDCPDESAVHVCFWEHKFQINPEELRSTGRLAAAGFALGNFNYRVERVGLNFVGTSVRDCTEDQFPSSCYGSGFVNYSIEHGPPYPVTNHAGDQYLAPLFTGRIEYARALAAERYLTNPLSSADRALIEPYSRGELRGRPLTGAYTVRIWDDGVVNFDRIEDVQILLDYRYWTRFH